MAELREVFNANGYTDKELIARFGDVPVPTARNHGLPRFLRMTAAGSRADVLVRLFLLGAVVPEAAARAALRPVLLKALLASGFLEQRGGDVAAIGILLPHDGLWMAADHPERLRGGATPDLVMAFSGSSLDLARLTIRRHVRKAFDFGTGCGIQAFLAARHSDEVWAADRSARAAAFARFNAAVNGIANVRVVEGDGFAPAAGERFDLIAGNLPFVITPGRRYLYRDNDLPLDEFARKAVRDAAAHLEEGGFCQYMCQWVHFAGGDWEQRLAGWFDGLGCDAFVLRQVSTHPLGYAESWIRDTESGGPALFARLFNEWSDYYEREGIEGISTGFVVMRRRSGVRNWFQIGDVPADVPQQYGDHLLCRFAAQDFLESACSDEALLQARLRISSDVRLMTECDWTAGGWRIAGAELRQPKVGRSAANVDGQSLQLLAYCDGARTLREVFAEAAGQLHAPAERLAAAGLPGIRQLIGFGFLLPVD
jgi:methylase of polypeptide subunit release factors